MVVSTKSLAFLAVLPAPVFLIGILVLGLLLGLLVAKWPLGNEQTQQEAQHQNSYQEDGSW